MATQKRHRPKRAPGIKYRMPLAYHGRKFGRVETFQDKTCKGHIDSRIDKR